MRLVLEGIYPALTTPFEDQTVSPLRFKENISKYNNYDLSGYVVLGSTGEAVYVTDDEAETLVQAAREAIPPDKTLIAGTGKESTQQTIALTRRLADSGADAALVRTPSYYKSSLTRTALGSHYTSIADSSPIPLIIYCIPQQTGLSLEADLIAELSLHPNIIGIKDSSGDLDQFQKMIALCPSDFSVLTGAGHQLLACLQMGARGAILAAAAAAPAHCLELYSAFTEKDKRSARDLQEKLLPLNAAITQTLGIAGAKYALDLTGFYGGPCRRPLLPLTERGKRTIKKIIKAINHKIPTHS